MKSNFKKTVIGFLLVVTVLVMQSCENKSIPAIAGIDVSGITQTSAMAGSNITSDGGSEITARGVVWNTSGNPTTNSSATNEGTGAAYFLTIITGLTPNTTYFVRAYATNSEGTVYGEEVSFKTSPQQEDGTQKADFPGGSRSGATGFSIGNKLYIGLGGYDNGTPTKDFFEWDEATNLWSEKVDFPGNAVGAAVGFSIGTKGYIATGATSDGKVSNELWEYDPATDTWTQKASLPASAARAFATGFSIGTKGYIGTGFVTDDLAWAIGINYRMDFWEWDQETNTWTEKASLPENSHRASAVGFSIGTKGYIGTGFVTDGVSASTIFKDFLEWDQTNDTWTQKADFGGSYRDGAVGFSIGNKGYIGAGQGYERTYNKDVWEWAQETDTWTRETDLEGYARAFAVGVSTGNKGYIGMGYGTPYSTLKDLWEYDPD